MRTKLADVATPLLPHQQRVVDRMLRPDQTGLVVAHGLGSGKTLTSIAAQDALRMPASVILPAALQENYAKERAKHLTGETQPVDMTTLQAVARRGQPPAGQLLIIDEAHRIRDPSTKGFKALRKAEAEKRMLLTATPFYNAVSDVAPLINIAAGQNILPNDPREFYGRYVTEQTVMPSWWGKTFRGETPGTVEKLNPKAIPELRAAFQQYIDYHPSAQEGFPSVERKDIKVEMSPEQLKVYDTLMQQAPKWVAAKIKAGLPPSKQESKDLNAFLTAVRQVSNTTAAYAPSEQPHQPKIEHAFKNLQQFLGENERAKAVVYSNYLDSGIKPYASMLDQAGIPYGMFTGEMKKKERDQMIRDYNEGRLRALLLSSAGGEGLDLKGTRLIQVLDPHWNEEKLHQVEGRGIRYGSHADLPEEERKVLIERYLATRPRQGLLEKLHIAEPGGGVDEYLAGLSQRKENLHEQFRRLIPGYEKHASARKTAVMTPQARRVYGQLYRSVLETPLAVRGRNLVRRSMNATQLGLSNITQHVESFKNKYPDLMGALRRHPLGQYMDDSALVQNFLMSHRGGSVYDTARALGIETGVPAQANIMQHVKNMSLPGGPAASYGGLKGTVAAAPMAKRAAVPNDGGAEDEGPSGVHGLLGAGALLAGYGLNFGGNALMRASAAREAAREGSADLAGRMLNDAKAHVDLYSYGDNASYFGPVEDVATKTHVPHVGFSGRLAESPGIVAHELGHAAMDMRGGRLGRLVTRTGVPLAKAAPYVGMVSGAVTGASDDPRVQAAGVLAPAALHLPQLISEGGATLHGLHNIRRSGGTWRQVARGARTTIPAFTTYAAMPVLTAAGALMMQQQMLDQLHEAEQAQKTAELAEDGKHKLQGRISFQGLNIAVENRKGSVRSGTTPDGHKWRTVMKAPYGYFDAPAKGKDGESIDVYVGPHKKAPDAFVVHQHKPDGTGHDEDKVILGVKSLEAAKKLYLQHYDSGKFLGPVSKVPVDELKKKLETSDRLEKISAVYALWTKQAFQQLRDAQEAQGFLQPGDILLTRTKNKTSPLGSLFGKVLEKAQDSKFYHSAMYTGDGKVVHSRIGEGITEVPLDKFHDMYKYRVYRVKGSDDERQQAANFARQMLAKGKPYYTMGLLKTFTKGDPSAPGDRTRERDKYICSSLVAAGYPNRVFNGRALDHVRPVDLGRSDQTELVAAALRQ